MNISRQNVSLTQAQFAFTSYRRSLYRKDSEESINFIAPLLVDIFHFSSL